MSSRGTIPDFVPALTSAMLPARRGGRRPGAGAPKGNVNALKHGRRSRFAALMPPRPIEPAAVAHRLLQRDRRAAEQLAASFLRLARDARWKRAVADAAAGNGSIPPAPVVTSSAHDLRRVTAFLRERTAEARLTRALGEGRLKPNHPALKEARRFADRVDTMLPAVAGLLDRVAASDHNPASLAGLLTPPDNQTNNQPPIAISEPASPAAAPHAESASVRKDSNKQSTSRRQPRAGTPTNVEAPPLSLLGEGAGG